MRVAGEIQPLFLEPNAGKTGSKIFKYLGPLNDFISDDQMVKKTHAMKKMCAIQPRGETLTQCGHQHIFLFFLSFFWQCCAACEILAP